MAAVLVIIAAALLRSRWERGALKIKEYEIASRKIPEEFDGKKLVFLTDLHNRRFGEGNRLLSEMVLQEEPAAVLIGGDMMTVKPWLPPDFTALQELLDALDDRVPVFYADGNHEERMRVRKDVYPGWEEAFRKLLSSYRLTYLRDEHFRLIRGKSYISLYAFSFSADEYRKFSLPPLSAKKITEKIGKPEGFSLVLAHTPHYFKSFSDWGADLVLSGHNHGGTIRLPFLGGVMTPQFFFFSRYAYGLVEDGDHKEIISAGLGTHSINIRLFNRPEVVVVRLVRKEDGKEHV